MGEREEIVCNQEQSVQVGRFRLVLTAKRPKRCKDCGSSQRWPVIVKKSAGAIGNIHFCVSCGTFTVNTPEDVWTYHRFVDMVENVEKMARTASD